ncbi:MAG TPA: CDP-alcohol phosphatidyltransferase family protein [Actinoplanes sp.]|jgi:phosphatidylglycerophosphate synthase
MAHRPALAEIRARTYKRRDAWWTVWLVDPLASRLVWLVSPWRVVTPNLLTTFAFVIGLGSAAAFWRGSYGWLLIGALLFHLSFVLDCMDGKIARLNGTGSVFGAWLDYVFDRLRVLACAVGLFGGQYQRTHDFAYVWLAGLVIFLDMFRYLNALQMGKVKADMKANLAAATGTEQPVVFAEEAEFAADDAPERVVVDVYGDFRDRFALFVRMRNLLLRGRIRAHVISGIEFMMFVFIVGPVVNQVIVVTLISAALMIAFELLLIYKLWTATRSFARRMRAIVPSQPVASEDAVQHGDIGQGAEAALGV